MGEENIWQGKTDGETEEGSEWGVCNQGLRGSGMGEERPGRRQNCMGANKEGEQRLYGRKTIKEEMLNGRRDPWRRNIHGEQKA